MYIPLCLDYFWWFYIYSSHNCLSVKNMLPNDMYIYCQWCSHVNCLESHILTLVRHCPQNNSMPRCLPADPELQIPARSGHFNNWLVVCNIFYFPIYWECHHPHWLSYSSEGWPNHQPDKFMYVFNLLQELVDSVQCQTQWIPLIYQWQCRCL